MQFKMQFKRCGPRRTHPALPLVLAAAVCGCAAAAAGETAAPDDGILYMENSWNYVDGAIDAQHGIPADAVGVLASIRKSGVLRVATEPDFPPQEFIDDTLPDQERFVGSDMEMARLIAERMGVSLEIVPMEFSKVLPSLREGECDLAISALSYTPERAAIYTLSKGYHYAQENAGCGILVRTEDLDRIRTVSDLADCTLVAQSGSLQEAMAADHVLYYKEFRRLLSTQDVYQALADGWADAAVVDIETAEQYIENHPEEPLSLLPEIRFQLEPELDGDRIAAKKNELQLIYFVNGIINELLESGQYEDWFDQYSSYGEQASEASVPAAG